MKLTKKMKKIIGAVICSSVLIATGSAYAGVTCDNATITKTGIYPYLPATVSYAVYATCSDTPAKWSGEVMFIVAKDDYADPLYAAALTAVSTGNNATMIVTNGAQFGTVKMLSVQSAP